MTLVKLDYLNEIRITQIKEQTLNALYEAFTEKFNLKEMRLRPRFLLKYLDLDGDWVTLSEDSDVVIAFNQMKNVTLRLKLVDSYQNAGSSNNEEWDLRPLFAQLINSPAVQLSITKVCELYEEFLKEFYVLIENRW